MPQKIQIKTAGSSCRNVINESELPVIQAWASGDLLRFPFEDDEISEKDLQMKSLAVMRISDEAIYAPFDATVEEIDAAGNLIVLQSPSELQVAIKVCKSCIHMAEEAEFAAAKGDSIKAGSRLASFKGLLHAKSKLLLRFPDTTQEFVEMGYQSVINPGLVRQGQPLLEIR